MSTLTFTATRLITFNCILFKPTKVLIIKHTPVLLTVGVRY